MKMVVSHRETSISSNIRAIIEQLNLNPVERRRLIDRTCDNEAIRAVSSPAKITIGVYGCREKNIDFYNGRGEDTSGITFTRDKSEKKLEERCEGKCKFDATYKTKMEIFNAQSKEKMRNFDSYHPERAQEMVTSPSGKVTIGVWDADKEVAVKRVGSFVKVIREQEVDGGKRCVVVSRSRKAEVRQRIPPEDKDFIEVTKSVGSFL
uniref:HI_1514_0 protein n=1 Tax=Fopius arisanus TaxID=64838 RepID=A0A0C9RZX4_9HYME